MAKFCGKCGTRPDEATGLCPKCDAARIPAQKNSALQRNVQNPPPVSTPHNQRKPPQKKHWLLKILLWLAVFLLLCAGALDATAYFGWLELPFRGTETGEFSWEGIPDTDWGLEAIDAPCAWEYLDRCRRSTWASLTICFLPMRICILLKFPLRIWKRWSG